MKILLICSKINSFSLPTVKSSKTMYEKERAGNLFLGVCASKYPYNIMYSLNFCYHIFPLTLICLFPFNISNYNWFYVTIQLMCKSTRSFQGRGYNRWPVAKQIFDLASCWYFTFCFVDIQQVVLMVFDMFTCIWPFPFSYLKKKNKL